MKSIILAAGEGKRLKPLTNTLPKCLVPLFGKSFLERQIETLRRCKIDDISIVTGYLGAKISFNGINYFKNPQYDVNNMVETLFCANEKLHDSVIVSYGDIIYEESVLKKLLESNDDYSVVIDLDWKKYWQMRFENPLVDAESLIMDKNGYIKEIGKKVKSLEDIQGQYIGLMKFEKKATEFIKEFYKKSKKQAENGVNPLNPNIPFTKSYMTDFLQALINEKCKIKAVTIHNGWLELDSREDYKLYNRKYQEGTLSDLISLDC